MSTTKLLFEVKMLWSILKSKIITKKRLSWTRRVRRRVISMTGIRIDYAIRKTEFKDRVKEITRDRVKYGGYVDSLS